MPYGLSFAIPEHPRSTELEVTSGAKPVGNPGKFLALRLLAVKAERRAAFPGMLFNFWYETTPVRALQSRTFEGERLLAPLPPH